MLKVKDLTVKYGDAQVLSGISFEAARGKITCVLGPNGAGKTTLLRSITGLVPAVSGRIFFEGNEIRGRLTHDLVRKGLIMVPEGRRLWPSLTVAETLHMGAYLINDPVMVEDRMSFVFQLFPHLDSRKSQLCGTLSGGEQQMVAIGRGLMGSPKLLLLDEPSLGLAPLIVNEVFEAIEKIVETGTTILLVEQNVQVALTAAARGYVLETGAIVLEGDAAALRENPHVKEAYLGL
ncbi:MAG: ABC transporter ATP-binding protein [Desulfomonile tiedjei]|nr:ABC transporter ATP-binding protein [Desulfomonile tiedjei]